MSDLENPTMSAQPTRTGPHPGPPSTIRVCIVADGSPVSDGSDGDGTIAWIAELGATPGVEVRVSVAGSLWGRSRRSQFLRQVRAIDNPRVTTHSVFLAVRGADIVHTFLGSGRSTIAPPLRVAALFGKRTIVQVSGDGAPTRLADLGPAARRAIERADRIVVSTPELIEAVDALHIGPKATAADGPGVYEDVLLNPLRVCLVAPSTRILGGQAVQAERLRQRLEEVPEVRVRMLPINPRLSAPLRWLQKIKFVRTLVTQARYFWTLWPALRDADIAHIFSASYFSFVLAPTPALVVARLLGKRAVLNYRSGEAEDHLERWKRTAVPTIRLADRIVVGSGYLIDVFQRFGFGAHAIPNIVDLERYAYRLRTDLQPVFLANRNFEVHYNVGDVLRAFAVVQGEYPQARLIVAGDGPERAMLEEQSVELGLRGVEFRGQVPPDEMPDLYDMADIYINASLIDNMPTSLIEAFAAGTPVLTYATGGIPNIVEHERTGLMVAPKDYESLSVAALRVLRDPELAVRLAEAARAECLAKYTWQVVRDQWLEAYRGLVLGGLASRPS